MIHFLGLITVTVVYCYGARDSKAIHSSPTRNQINNATRKQKVRKQTQTT